MDNAPSCSIYAEQKAVEHQYHCTYAGRLPGLVETATAKTQSGSHQEDPWHQQWAWSLTEAPTFKNKTTFLGQYFGNGF